LDVDARGDENMRAGTRVLLVEDDPSIASFVEPELEHLDFRVRCAYDGLSGLDEAETFGPELVILDIMLSKLDGVGVLKRLRQGGSSVPIIMLTARDTTLDKVHSLDLGADDYLTKPFDIEELLARIRALLLVRSRSRGCSLSRQPSPSKGRDEESVAGSARTVPFEGDESEAACPYLALHALPVERLDAVLQLYFHSAACEPDRGPTKVADPLRLERPLAHHLASRLAPAKTAEAFREAPVPVDPADVLHRLMMRAAAKNTGREPLQGSCPEDACRFVGRFGLRVWPREDLVDHASQPRHLVVHFRASPFRIISGSFVYGDRCRET
jgi:CheY-like chemotaxis protein